MLVANGLWSMVYGNLVILVVIPRPQPYTIDHKQLTIYEAIQMEKGRENLTWYYSE